MKKRKLMPNEKEDNDNIQPIKYDPENFRGSGNSLSMPPIVRCVYF
ncbi:unnamed protein product [Brassica napus]|uniref:Uncharacterized protein n=2 Tax=Brassica TaxID=3705 RepID=A0A3P6CL60_BRAOL|nr:unnamed protein product [Brassica napus]VDD11195.1 unnamed protein product [Brassica oleracea]